MLPYYFLPDIFKYLELDDQRQLRLVSKEWNGFLLPFVFSVASTNMSNERKILLRKYSGFVRELHVHKLDARMTDLLSAFKNTTYFVINLKFVSPEAALTLGEKFPCLSYLELICGDPDRLRYLSPLTRKVQTLKYHLVRVAGPRVS
ncbi:hypothetical protein DSO57_1001484 [Entomophthora muscae]|uniref:Uncharacterized protein n=1 Tax=Entomophthora muscae TaxID=34485 RepID=A0ACC2UUK1_9FUNG|nr:hypothetical protein DSO57_1001484 [Entomophthora muscae]